LQDRRQEERAELKLDLILEAAESYLGLFRSNTIERVQREHLAKMQPEVAHNVAAGDPGRIL